MQSPPDGDKTRTVSITSSAAKPLPGSRLWRDAKFLTLAAGMALGLFAQIGLAVHLFSLLVPALGATPAGLAMGLVTAMAIAGRTLIGWALPAGADRRLVACASYAVQIAGCAAFIAADGTSVPLLLLGVVLFGAGFGNGTWLPPLIAQAEFVAEDVPRVVALIVAISQGAYAFAPVVFGTVREFTTAAADAGSDAAPGLFIVAGIVQGLAICAFLAGRRRGYRVGTGLSPR
jgi:MFS family permease